MGFKINDEIIPKIHGSDLMKFKQKNWEYLESQSIQFTDSEDDDVEFSVPPLVDDPSMIHCGSMTMIRNANKMRKRRKRESVCSENITTLKQKCFALQTLLYSERKNHERAQ